MSGSQDGTVNIEIKDNTSQFFKTDNNNIGTVNSMTPLDVTKYNRFRVINGNRYQVSRGTQPITVVSAANNKINFDNVGITNVSTVYKIEPVKVYSVTITADNNSLIGDNIATTVLRATLKDVAGATVVSAANQVTFGLTGPGTLVGTNPCPAVAGQATITLKSGFTPGTVNVTAAVQNLQSPVEHVYAIRLKGTPNTIAGGFIYRDYATRPGCVLSAGDMLEYDIFIPTWSAGNCSVDIEVSGATLRDSGAVDQNGIPSHPGSDLSVYALGKWYHRKISIPASLHTKSIESVEVVVAGNTVSEVYVNDLRLTNNGAERIVFFNNTRHAKFNLEKFDPFTQNYTENYAGEIELINVVTFNSVSSTTVQIISGQASTILCSANPTTIIANSTSVSTLTVTLVDVNNNVVYLSTNTVTFSVRGQGTLDGQNPCPAVAGQATIRFKSSTGVGTSTITAVSPGLVGSTVAITMVHGPAYKLVTTINPGSVSVNNELGNNVTSTATVTCQIFDYYTNPVITGPDSTKLIVFSLPSGQNVGTWTDGSTADKQVAATNGTATIKIKSVTIPGTIVVVSSGTNVVGSSVTIPVSAGIATKISCVVNPASIIADGVSVSTITARVTDANDNTVAGYNQNISFSITGAGSWPDGSVLPQSIPCLNGIATIVYRSTVTVGVSTITATSGSLTQGTVSITRVPGLANKLTVVGSQFSVTADGFSISTLTARVYDVNNNPVTSANNLVTFVLSGAGTIEGSPVNAVAGIATARYKSGTVAQVSTITVSATGLVLGTTNVTTLSGTAVKQILTSNPSVIDVGGQTSTVTIKVTDIYGNIKTNYSGNLILTISGEGTWLDNSVGASLLALTSGVGFIGIKSISNAGSIIVVSSSIGLAQGQVNIITQIGQPSLLQLTVDSSRLIADGPARQ
jgi:hypothetical protein